MRFAMVILGLFVLTSSSFGQCPPVPPCPPPVTCPPPPPCGLADQLAALSAQLAGLTPEFVVDLMNFGRVDRYYMSVTAEFKIVQGKMTAGDFATTQKLLKAAAIARKKCTDKIRVAIRAMDKNIPEYIDAGLAALLDNDPDGVGAWIDLATKSITQLVLDLDSAESSISSCQDFLDAASLIIVAYGGAVNKL